MPAERIGMRDVREIIRLKVSGVSTHEIARRLGMARSTVRETLKRADGAGLPWPLPEDMTADSDEVAQAFRFDGAQDSDLKPPSARSLAGRSLVAPNDSLGQPLSAGFERVRRRLSPDRLRRWALWTSRSRMASA